MEQLGVLAGFIGPRSQVRILVPPRIDGTWEAHSRGNSFHGPRAPWHNLGRWERLQGRGGSTKACDQQETKSPASRQEAGLFHVDQKLPGATWKQGSPTVSRHILTTLSRSSKTHRTS